MDFQHERQVRMSSLHEFRHDNQILRMSSLHTFSPKYSIKIVVFL